MYTHSVDNNRLEAEDKVLKTKYGVYTCRSWSMQAMIVMYII